MSILSKITDKIRGLNTKQLVIAGTFTLALAGAIGLGIANKQFASAVGLVRDCDNGNSILNVGPCGALTADELVNDARSNNPSDVQAIYNHFGLSPSEYDRFKSTAVMGKLWKNGNLEDDKGNIVAKNSFTVGRHSHGSPWRYPFKVAGSNSTYYFGYTQNSFGPNTDFIYTLIMFDENGTVETAILTACGNPSEGEKVPSGAECTMLNKTEVPGKKNTYKFTTDVHKFGFAQVTKVDYYIFVF